MARLEQKVWEAMTGLAKSRDHLCFASQTTIAEQAGCSRRTVIRCQAILETKKKIIRCTQRLPSGSIRHTLVWSFAPGVRRLSQDSTSYRKPSPFVPRNTHSVRVSTHYGWHTEGSMMENEHLPGLEPPSRPPDLCWDALVAVTGAMPEVERGPLNTALKAIRAQCARDGINPDQIPNEIHRRAKLYREGQFRGLTLTPMALAKNWIRVLPIVSEQRESLPEMYQRLKEAKKSTMPTLIKAEKASRDG